MAVKGKCTGKWKSGSNEIKVILPVILFEEDGSQITYCPALELSGYGNTEKESMESFNVVLSEFFLYTTNKKTLMSELERMGWTVRKNKTKPMFPPKMSELLTQNDNFLRIFNNFSYKKIDQNITMPI